jgi:hypothetical protein
VSRYGRADTGSDVAAIVTRYAHRGSIHTAIAGGEQLLGIGQARPATG